jgi:transglutaminase-like putative cysteine protease
MSENTEPSGLRARLDARESSGLSAFRLLAVLSGVGLLWSFLSVFYELADVGGNVDPFLTVIVLALVGGTVAARFVPVRIGLVAGVVALGGGIAWYLASVPEVLAGTASFELVAELGVYLAGVTVLNFLRIDLWVVAVAPAPTFACWYFLLHRRYDLAALVGGLALAFFTLTTDAATETTLIGSLSLLSMLAFGGLERADGTWHQVERAALVGLLGLLGARMVSASGNAAVSIPGGDGQPTLESTLLENNDSVEILGSIELSPEVRFSVEADSGVYWRVGAHDRYTGDGWLRTGASRRYDGTLSRPVGSDRRIVQEYEIRDDSLGLPAAWKPTEIDGDFTDTLRLTSLEGFKPAPSETIEAGTEYTVTSHAPTASIEELRRAGDDYPEALSDEYVRIPDSTPDRVGELAADIADGADTPYGKVSAIERWLEANKAYSLDISRPNGDIVDGFLFSMSEGYCVYFATATVVMLRTLGVPARFVTGYTTGQRVDSGEWLVRGLNSHAWVEVYFSGIGWMPFDPTPGSSRGEARENAVERARRANDGDVDIPGSRPTTTAGPTTESTPDQTTDPNSDQTTDPNPDQTTDPNSDQTTDSAPNQTTDPNSDQTTDPNPDQTTDPNSDQTTDSAPDQTTDPNSDPIIGPPGDTTPATDTATNQPGVTTTEPPTGRNNTDTGGAGPSSPPGSPVGTPTTTRTGNATETPESDDGGGIAGIVRDRVTVLGSAAALALGAHHFGAIDRVSRELWLREQTPTDSPQADAERAFARVEHLLKRRYRERKSAETPRQYLDAIGVNDTRVRHLMDIYERAHYGGEVTREEATEAIRLADDVITGS